METATTWRMICLRTMPPSALSLEVGSAFCRTTLVRYSPGWVVAGTLTVKSRSVAVPGWSSTSPAGYLSQAVVPEVGSPSRRAAKPPLTIE